MQKIINHDNNIAQMPLEELRQKWVDLWGMRPHVRIGRTLLERSIEFKQRERSGQGMTEAQRKRLEHLVRSYKVRPQSFDEKDVGIKPGTKLIKIWNDERHVVDVLPDGFEYKGVVYTHISQVARKITGTVWNGWEFFHLKKTGKEQ